MGPGLLSALAAAGCSMASLTEPLPGSWDIFVNHCVSGSNASADTEGRSTRQCSVLIQESRLQLLSFVIQLCVCVCVCVCVLGPHKTESLGSRKITRFYERAYTPAISPPGWWGCQGPHCIHTSNCFMAGQARLLPPGRPQRVLVLLFSSLPLTPAVCMPSACYLLQVDRVQVFFTEDVQTL